MMIINILRITQDPVMKSQSSVSLIFIVRATIFTIT